MKNIFIEYVFTLNFKCFDVYRAQFVTTACIIYIFIIRHTI